MSRRTILTTGRAHCACGRITMVVVGDNHALQPCACGATPILTVGGIRRESIYPFTSCNIDGKGTPITIESTHHARQLERRWGVKFTALSDNRSNWDDHTMRGDLPVFKGQHGHYGMPER